MLTLRPYQERVIADTEALLWDKGLAYLALATRTGKTFMALSVCHRMSARRVLFLTKLAAMSSIKDDYKSSGYKFRLEVLSIDSAAKAIGNYDIIIVDEAHNLGTFPKPSKRAKAVREIVGETPVIFLSATPTPESWSQIYHQLFVSALSPFREYKTFYKWAKAFVDVRERRFGALKVPDYSHAKEAVIQAVVSPYMLTLTQEEAGFSQVLTEQILRVKINPHIHTLIKLLIKDRYYRLRDGGEIVCDTPASLMQKCHQLSGGTVLDANGLARTLDRTKALTIREKFKGRKIAVYYKFVAELEMLKDVFPRWTSNPDVFRRDAESVFLGQFVSAREGIELSVADVMVFFATDYSYLSYAQSKERIQKKDRATIPELWFVFSDTGLEEKIHARLMDKKNFTARWFMQDYCGRTS